FVFSFFVSSWLIICGLSQRVLYWQAMTSDDISKLITDRFGEKITAALPSDKHPRVHVNAEHWRELAEFLIQEPSLRLDWLANLSGIDYVADEKFCVVYDLYSYDLRHTFAVK